MVAFDSGFIWQVFGITVLQKGIIIVIFCHGFLLLIFRPQLEMQLRAVMTEMNNQRQMMAKQGMQAYNMPGKEYFDPHGLYLKPLHS